MTQPDFDSDDDEDEDEDEGTVSLFFVVVIDSILFEALISWLLLKQMLKKEIVFNILSSNVYD